ncbi:hypothetical protein [Acinetobacter sp. ANC 4178]|uniref:hypothetical protein n=1 Tax=Acinetobacter sp. ANC 4178 TaxID=2529839 RepID=UPI00103A75AE|nr:hypothetical protein [Acinetobacter sp. ANC 4178]TCB67794.1 hypothetical protein E0H87_06315 [Acinetobacter sp. ANC 4178]
MKELALKIFFYLSIVFTLCSFILAIYAQDLMFVGIGVLLAIAAILLGLESKQFSANPFRK